MAAKRLSLADSFFLNAESRDAYMHVAMLHRYALPEGAGPDWVGQMIARMKSYPVDQSPFNLRLKTGLGSKVAPAWEVDDKIDIDYHLRHAALPHPGGERELGVLISRLHSQPLDKNRPLWECTIIEGLDDGSFAIYFKIHHALMDGMSGSRTMSRCLSPDPRNTNMPAFWAMPPLKRASAAVPKAIAESAQALARTNVLSVLGQSFKAWMRMLRAAPESGLIGPYRSPSCSLNAIVSPQRRFATQSLPIDRMKAVATNAGGTLNDIVLAVCATALRRYLLEQGDLPIKPLVSSIPVSIRTREEAGEGNGISLALASLGTHIADPKARFEHIKASMQANKDLLGTLSKPAMTLYTNLLMAPFMIGQMTGLAARTKRPMYNTMVSNVPGPTEVLYLNGARLLSAYPVSLIFNGQALNITLLSYDGHMHFGFTACRVALPRVQKIAVYLGEALEEIERDYACGISASVA
ncbi:wax ester/triacylglycerol synthase family O-acyltransferase [Paraperlucidibaca wandonensis]|uniref:diacylglycerol O-acyltransferase n=1 Tax=Paraperlucidibaca wandonensis TaxID=1268273 RepID=A0ABW3HJ59_9GAMM